MDKLSAISTIENFKIIKKDDDNNSKELFASGVFNLNIKDSFEFNIYDLILKIEFKSDVNDIVKKDGNQKKLELIFPYPPEYGKRSFTDEVSFGKINNKSIYYYLTWEFTTSDKNIILITYSFYEKLEKKEC